MSMSVANRQAVAFALRRRKPRHAEAGTGYPEMDDEVQLLAAAVLHRFGLLDTASMASQSFAFHSRQDHVVWTNKRVAKALAALDPTSAASD
jgi:hypothetical protein